MLMKILRVHLCLILTLIASSVAADPPEVKSKAPPAVPKFVVYSSVENAELAASLFRILRGKDKVDRILKADSIEKAADSEAEVLILVMPGKGLPKLSPQTMDALKKKKLVGIGSDAARLFGRLGLEIKLDACAHFGAAPPDIYISKSKLLGDPKVSDAIPVLERTEQQEANGEKLDTFALFIPPDSPMTSVIDVIARFTGDSNYAPIVRQGNCILIGLPAPATQWSQDYATLVRDASRALLARKQEPFAMARPELTKPGTYEFKLAKGRSSTESFEKTFYLDFREPTVVTAHLEHSGSGAMMLLFMGDSEDRLHWTRQDAKQEQPLDVTTTISAQDIQALGDRYWTLKVTNFDVNGTAQCKLKITCEALKKTD